MRPFTTASRPVRLAAVGVALAAAIAGPVASFAASPAPVAAKPAPAGSGVQGLKVLLVNDDSAQGTDTRFGTNGKGLYELRKSLCAAGADVLVVAPWSQQSGASARMTTPGLQPVSLHVSPVTVPAAYAGDCASAPSAGATFGVCVQATPCTATSPSGSPADAVNIALSRFAANYWPEGPDVVLSGTNFGQNVGSTTNHSGTVGAVITAAEYDVPAIAVSAEVPHDLAQIPNVPFAATADFTVKLLDTLVRFNKLSDDLILNVNHPFVGAGETMGKPMLTATGASSDLGLTFSGDVGADGGSYTLNAGAPQEETVRRADTTALAGNNIAITPLDGSWGGSSLALTLLLSALR